MAVVRSNEELNKYAESKAPLANPTFTGIPKIENDNIASISTSVTDNAIARYDGTTGKLQNSGVIIDDAGNLGVGVTPSAVAAGRGLEVGLSGGFYGDGITYQHNTQMTQNAYPIAGGGYKFRNTGQNAGMYIIAGQVHNWKNANYLGTAGNTITVSNLMTLDQLGNLLLTSGTGSIGYGTGAGGTVTQLTSKSTAVTLNKPSGGISMNNAALAAGASVTFALNNSLCSLYDGLYVQIIEPSASSSANYRVSSVVGNSGICYISVTNMTSGSLSEALILQFMIIKGAIV